MIDQLHLRRIKAWHDSGPVQLAPVTMLLGSNSSGKSTLLQSLLLLRQTALAPDRSVHLNLGTDEGRDAVHIGRFSTLLAQGLPAPQQCSIALQWQRPEGERGARGRYACTWGATAQGAPVVQTLELASVARSFRLVRRAHGAYALYVDGATRPRGVGPELAPERAIALPPQALALLGADAQHLQDLSLALYRTLESLIHLGPLRRLPARELAWSGAAPGELGPDGQHAGAALLASALVRSPQQGSVLRSVAHWLERMGMAEQLSVQPVGRTGRYELLVHHDGVAANLRDVGVGVAQVLPVLAVAYSAAPGSTVLVEEPELHLHPLAQAVLAEMFAEVSQQRQVQFVVETHSEHLFRRMQTLIARRQLSTAQCRMLFVERRGAQAVLTPLDVDAFGAVRNWPPRFFGDAMGEAREQARARLQRLREADRG